MCSVNTAPDAANSTLAVPTFNIVQQCNFIHFSTATGPSFSDMISTRINPALCRLFLLPAPQITIQLCQWQLDTLLLTSTHTYIRLRLCLRQLFSGCVFIIIVLRDVWLIISQSCIISLLINLIRSHNSVFGEICISFSLTIHLFTREVISVNSLCLMML